jgi:nicotinamidase-related amidase
MNNVFSPQNTAIILIDHQQGPIKLSKSINHNKPFQDPLGENIKKIAPKAYTNSIKRTNVLDAWMYDDFQVSKPICEFKRRAL